jgi:hypothetical protein
MEKNDVNETRNIFGNPPAQHRDSSVEQKRTMGLGE